MPQAQHIGFYQWLEKKGSLLLEHSPPTTAFSGGWSDVRSWVYQHVLPEEIEVNRVCGHCMCNQDTNEVNEKDHDDYCMVPGMVLMAAREEWEAYLEAVR